MIANRVVGALLVVMLASAGCITGEGKLYFEPSIRRPDVHIRRIAIVPNRLPLNLQNAEYWTERNWEKLAEMFRARGFEVIDYATSRGAFNEGGLPLEDTKSSRDKYADLARRLAVDAIVIPYYGTYGTATQFLFATRADHVAVATLQIFLADKNDFFTRADASGRYRWTSGLGMTLGMILAGGGSGLLASTSTASRNGGLALLGVGGGIALIGIIADLVVAAIPDNSKFGKAFDKAFEEALGPFFAAFAPGSFGGPPTVGYGSATPYPPPYAPVTMQPPPPAPAPAPAPAAPTPQPSAGWADPFARPATPPPATPPPAPAPMPPPAPTTTPPPSGSFTDELERACGMNNAASCLKLGQSLRDGKGTPVDERRASAAFQRACGLRDPDGCAQLGELYERGGGVPKNVAVAVTLYKQACAGGRGSACLRVGQLLRAGDGIAKDDVAADGYFRRACELKTAAPGCGGPK